MGARLGLGARDGPAARLDSAEGSEAGDDIAPTWFGHVRLGKGEPPEDPLADGPLLNRLRVG